MVFITTLDLRRDAFSFNVLEIPRGAGSGFIWDETGLVVTNFHVILNADEALCRSFPCKRISRLFSPRT